MLLSLGLLGPAEAATSAGWTPTVGDFATYEVSGLPAGFDDGGEGAPAVLGYRWRVDGVTDRGVSVVVNATLEIGDERTPGSVLYAGEAAATAAERGDHSFVRRIPRANIDPDRVFIGRPDGPGWSSVEFLGPMTFSFEERILIDRSGRAHSEDGTEFRWVMWIDPDAVPFGSSARLERWTLPNGTRVVNDVIVENAESAGIMGSQLASRGIDRETWIRSGSDTVPMTVGPEDARRSWSVQFQDVYDARAGILLASPSGCFVDDLLADRLGLVYFCGRGIRLVETSIEMRPIEEARVMPWSVGSIAMAGLLAALALLPRRSR